MLVRAVKSLAIQSRPGPKWLLSVLKFKVPLVWKEIFDDDELKVAIEAWFEDQIDNFYFKGIDCLKEKWAKCIEVKGDYIEK